MPNVLLVQSGQPTPEGEKLLAWLESQVSHLDKAGADVNVNAMNAMSGDAKEYYAITRSKAKTPAGWMEAFTSSAQNAYMNMTYLESKAAEEEAAKQKLNESSEATNKIEAELKAFKESIAEQVKELEKQNAELRAELEKKANKGGRPPKVTAEPEAEEETTTAEDDTAGG